MSRRLALLALTVFLVGCSKPRTRAQGPFNRTPPAPNPVLLQTPPSPPARASAQTPQPPAAPGGALPVPPRPPEPAAIGPAFAAPPQPPTAPPAAAPVSPAASAAPVAADAGLAAIKEAARAAAERWKGIDAYEARLTRRESVNGAAAPTEEVLFRFRKQPMSVYMKNVGEAGRGREVLYNPTQFDDKIHVIVGAGDSRLLGAGNKAPSLSPDSPMVKGKSRHSIRDIGFGTSINRFAAAVAGVEGGKLPAGTLKYGGRVNRPEFGDALVLAAVEQTIRPGDEAHLPAGGVRQWYFDATPKSPSAGLPVLVVTIEKGREVEYYCLTGLTPNPPLTDADFDPARMGKKK